MVTVAICASLSTPASGDGNSGSLGAGGWAKVSSSATWTFE
jgi:hypothetical protein